MAGRLFFAIPGDLETRTGGYVYDKRLIAELRRLGSTVEHLAWPGAFPYPGSVDLHTVAESLAGFPNDALVLVDGLAFGAMSELAEAHKARLHLVALVHHPLALETGLSPAVADRLAHSERRALAAARFVITTSRTTAGILAADFAVPRSRMLVAPPGTDLPASPTVIPAKAGIHPAASAGGAVDSRFRGNDDWRDLAPIHLLGIGTVTYRKGFDILVEALGEIRDLLWTCTIAGSTERSPETYASITAQIDRLALNERVSFVGELSDLQPLYQDADLFVLPSRYEGFGMVFAEAMAHGLPIVATATGAIPEVVPPEAGILVTTERPDLLALALRQLIGDREARRAMGWAARLAAEVLPRWEETAALVASALDQIE